MKAIIDAATAYGQRMNRSTCVVSRPGGEPVFDPNTGTYTDPEPTTVYDGACKIVPTGGERVVEFGEGPVTLRTYLVTLDGTTGAPQIGDDVSVSGSRDPRINAAGLVVLDVPGSDYLSNRQLVVEEQT